jgi:hypothetical protein
MSEMAVLSTLLDYAVKMSHKVSMHESCLRLLVSKVGSFFVLISKVPLAEIYPLIFHNIITESLCL